MAPYNKRKRDHHGGHDFRPRLSPAEQREQRVRKGIAEIGEPSRLGRDVVLENLSADLRETAPEAYAAILAITRAVVYEQPHKIGYLAYLFEDANAKAEQLELPFLVLEMAHDELTRAAERGDYDRFKVFLRFLCALAPIVENADELVRVLRALVAQARDAALPVHLKTQLYKTALFAAVYLPRRFVTAELRAELVDIQFEATADDGAFDFFFGDDAPYATQSVGSLYAEAARKLDASGWDVDFLARNPLGSAEPTEPADLAEPKESKQGEPSEPSEPSEAKEATEATEVKDSTEAPEPQNSMEDAVESEPQAPEAEQTLDPAAEPAKAATAAGGEPSSTTSEPTQPSDAAPVAARAAPKHRIRVIHLPETWPAPAQRLHSDAFCRIYLPTNGVETVPEPANMLGLLLRDVTIDVIRHIDFNRREVTRQLIALDMFFNQRVFAPPGVPLDTVLQYTAGEPTWKIEDMALEAIYSQMFDLSADGEPFPLVYYHTLLVEACVMAPQDIAPVLGRALRFLFNHCASADAELLFRTIDWFAHHVSNFAFTWKWNEWIDTLQLPEFHPQQVFVRELLAKQVRLSYPQRVRDVLPEEFQPLVPDTPDMPPFKFAQDEKVLRFVDALQNPGEQSPAELLAEFEPAQRADVLITCVCDLGNRSLTHASNWVAKTIDLVREFVTNETVVVEAVFAYWQQSQWIGALIVDQFIRSQLVSAQTYVDFVASHPDILLSSVGWEAIRDHPAEARRALSNVTLDREWGDWWLARLHKALDRKPVLAPVDAAPNGADAIDEDVVPQPEALAAGESTQTEVAQSANSEAPNGAAHEVVPDEAHDETDYEPQLKADDENGTE